MQRRLPPLWLGLVLVAATLAIATPLLGEVGSRRAPIQHCSKFGVGPFADRWLDACYGAAVERSLNEHGAAATALRFDRELASDRHLRGICHEMMHGAGRPVGKRLRTTGEVAKVTRDFPQETGSCAAGLLHGMFEGYVEVHGFEVGDRNAFAIMCGTARSHSGRKRRFDCAHGLGHAATLHYKSAVGRASAFCAAMAKPDGGDCLSGVLMSQVEGPRFDGGPMARLKSAGELTGFCDAFEGAGRTLCYRWIPLVPAFSTHKLGQDDVLAACNRAEAGSGERLACYIGIGRQAPVGISPCDELPHASDRAGCGYGLAVGRVINASLQPVGTTSKTCATVRDAGSREACYLGIGRVWPLMREGARGGQADRVCAELRPANQSVCLRGAGLLGEPFDYSSAEQSAIRSIVDGS